MCGFGPHSLPITVTIVMVSFFPALILLLMCWFHFSLASKVTPRYFVSFACGIVLLYSHSVVVAGGVLDFQLKMMYVDFSGLNSSPL